MNPPDALVRVLIVDDHEIVRGGLRACLSESNEVKVVGEAGTAAEAIALGKLLKPDVVVLDLRLPDRSGVDVCRELKLLLPEIKVLILTSYGDEANVLAGLAAGADGYLLKTITGSDIVDAAIKVAAGGAVLDPKVTRQMLDQFKPLGSRTAEGLSETELKILGNLADGLLNKEIANGLGISEKTVRNRLTTIYDKIGAASRSEAAIWFKQMMKSDRA